MKKSWLVVLVACAAAALSACSKGDEGTKPVNPVTEYIVPAKAEIGGAFEIKGKGFDSSAQIYLKNSTNTETAVEELVTSPTEAKFNIPATLTEGIYTVVLKQAGSWELGQVRLSIAQNPILNLEMPASIKLNKTLEIGGIGFTSASKIFLETADVAKTRTELTTTVNASGVSCVIPASVQMGNYNVVLKHNNIDWELGQNLPAAKYKRLVGFKKVDQTAYDFTNLDAIFEANKEQIASIIGLPEADKATFIMYLDMFYNGHEGVVTSETGVPEKYNYTGDQLTSITEEPESGSVEAWALTLTDGVISGENKKFNPTYGGLKTFTLTANNGRMESNTVLNVSAKGEERTSTYNWNYNQDGYCTTLTIQSNGNLYKTYVYKDNNLTGINVSTPLKYSAQSKTNNIFAPDAALFLLNAAAVEAFGKVAGILGLTGKPSAQLPLSIAVQNAAGETADIQLTWVLDADGYATSAAYSQTGVDPLFSVIPASSTVKYEFTYE